jgi:predicted HicB family RNase H-like nuclease
MPSELHGLVAYAATATGTTINDFINTAVSNEVAHVMK